MGTQIKFVVGGVEFFLSGEEVEQKLQGVEPEPIREIAVTVNGRQYPVKQALAEATGLLRGNFTSHEAMRVFRKLSLPLRTESAGTPSLPHRLAVFEDTQELTCPVCKKPYTFKKVSATQLELEGCSCNPPQVPREIPPGAIVTDLGGLWVIRAPRE